MHAQSNQKTNAEAAAQLIQLVVLDVDGVLTDGGLYYDEQGHVSKRFNVQDGLGIKLAQAAGIEFAVITGLDSNAVRQRVTGLGIDEYHPGFRHKEGVLKEISESHNIPLEHMAYVGDDFVDARPMRMVGLPMAVANAQPEIKELATWISPVPGGQGAVRAALRFILTAQGKWDELWKEWSE